MDSEVSWRRTVHSYDVELLSKDKYGRRVRRRYEVRREQSTWKPNEWRWTVEGGGQLRRHICEESGATHKRAVQAVLIWLGKAEENAA